MISFHLQDEELLLLPQKAIFWKRKKALLLADTHFGKVTHFRKSGIAIPGRAAYRNMIIMEYLIKEFEPLEVIFLGDLFHSEMNTEWLIFKEVLKNYPQTCFRLVQGNHDILHELSYTGNRFELHTEALEMGPFRFTHEPQECSGLYNLAGHIHPGVRLIGTGRQSMRLPCFWFGKNAGILPAFGQFTGLHLLKPTADDRVFVISGEEVMQMN